MTRVIRYSLGLMFAFFITMSFFMIFIPDAILIFPGSSWTTEQMASGMKIIKKDIVIKKANINPNE